MSSGDLLGQVERASAQAVGVTHRTILASAVRRCPELDTARVARHRHGSCAGSQSRSILIGDGDEAEIAEATRAVFRGRAQEHSGRPVRAGVERDGSTVIDQNHWVDAALELLGRVVGSATAYAKAKGIWRDDERGGALVKDEPVVIHCYRTPADVEHSRNLAALGSFCRRMGREARQGEVGLVIGGEYFGIRDFAGRRK